MLWNTVNCSTAGEALSPECDDCSNRVKEINCRYSINEAGFGPVQNKEVGACVRVCCACAAAKESFDIRYYECEAKGTKKVSRRGRSSEGDMLMAESEKSGGTIQSEV